MIVLPAAAPWRPRALLQLHERQSRVVPARELSTGEESLQWAALDVAQLKAPTRTAGLSSNDATDDATRTAGWSSSDATDRFVRAPITTRGPGPRPVREQGAWQHVRARRASRQRPHARRSSSARADEKPSCRGQPRGSYARVLAIRDWCTQSARAEGSRGQRVERSSRSWTCRGARGSGTTERAENGLRGREDGEGTARRTRRARTMPSTSDRPRARRRARDARSPRTRSVARAGRHPRRSAARDQVVARRGPSHAARPSTSCWALVPASMTIVSSASHHARARRARRCRRLDLARALKIGLGAARASARVRFDARPNPSMSVVFEVCPGRTPILIHGKCAWATDAILATTVSTLSPCLHINKISCIKKIIHDILYNFRRDAGPLAPRARWSSWYRGRARRLRRRPQKEWREYIIFSDRERTWKEVFSRARAALRGVARESGWDAFGLFSGFNASS